jgi:hypothetical protein
MVLGFNSPNNSPAKSSKAISIANAGALTEKMESIFKKIPRPAPEQSSGARATLTFVSKSLVLFM